MVKYKYNDLLMEVYVLKISSKLIAAMFSLSIIASSVPIQTAMADATSVVPENLQDLTEPVRKTGCKVTVSVYDKETGELYEGEDIEFSLKGGPDNAGSSVYTIVDGEDGGVQSELIETVPSCKVWKTSEGNPMTIEALDYEIGHSPYYIESIGILTDCCWWNIDTEMTQTKFDFEDVDEKELPIYLQRVYYIKNDLKRSEIEAQYNEETAERIQQAATAINLLINDVDTFRSLPGRGRIKAALAVMKTLKEAGFINDYTYSSAEKTIDVDYVQGMSGVMLPIVFGADKLPKTISGDLTGDGSVSIADAVKLQRFILGSSQMNDAEFFASDLNNDGSVNVYDFCLMRQALINRA